MSVIRRHYILMGDVQGVGLRYRAVHAARHFGVTGFVSNCPDGTVELEAEGEPADIDAVLLAIERGTFVRIENLRVREISVCGSLSFEIR